MSTEWKLRRFVAIATLLFTAFTAVCDAARTSRMLRETRRLQSWSCPTNPLELCDFYFDGYSSSLPAISLDGSPDTGVGPYIKDSVSGRIVQVGNTGDGELLCSGGSAGNQFYANGQQAQVRFRTFNKPKSLFENQCILLPLAAVQIGSSNLNWGDSNQDTYPNARRCVVFTTGPNNSSGCGTGGTPPSPPSLPTPAAPPPVEGPTPVTTPGTPPASPPPPTAEAPSPGAPTPELEPPQASPPAVSPAPSSTFPAIFAFGDSTVDAGTNNYLPNSRFKSNFLPYGQDFVPASGRTSNGKLVVDFIGDAFGVPGLPPFLQPDATFEFGANFGSSGSGVLDTTFCENDTVCITLTTQLAQFASIQSEYTPEELASSLFLISTGGNDYFAYQQSAALQQLNTTEYVTAVVTRIGKAVQLLYQLGARKFIVFDAPALGCLPFALAANNESESSPKCVEDANLLAAGHSQALDQVLALLSVNIPDLHVIQGKSLEFLVAATQDPTLFGLEEAYSACCGGGAFNGEIPCGLPGSTTCPNPAAFLFWDLLHPTQAAYGAFSDALLRSSSLVTPYGLETLAAL